MQKKAIIVSLIVLASVVCFAAWGFFTFMSHNVLESFGTMEEKFEENNNTVESAIQKAKKQISEKEFKKVQSVAIDIESSSNRLYDYIENLKQDMLEEHGINKEAMDYSKMDKPSSLLFKNNSERGKAFILEIELYKKEMLSKLENFSSNTYNDHVNSKFVTKRNDGKDWLEYEFDGFPIIATYTKLTSIQADIKNTKLKAYDLLLKE